MIFNSLGYLFPAKELAFTETEIETYFLQNEDRKKLYEEYLLYTMQLNNLVGGKFSQWIDGSFATTKPTPKDIDIVNFIPADKVTIWENDIRKLGESFPNLDIYTVKVYDKMESHFVYYQTDKLYWLYLFSHTRPNNRSGKKFAKGFIEITHL